MTKMQELNPKMQAIRNKYRSKLKDKQGRPNVEAQRQQNEEMMALYKKEGVNPASGCLPMLLQMPVFFAFYNVLAKAVELRQAEWIGWIHDLSAPDPFFVLPILMTASSFMMQRIMPSSPDPMQRRLLQIMPIAFGAFALYFPSGLVLYWFTNNLLTMGQQMLINSLRKKQQQPA
jgi:YidC/Oxa1 family membrane protein insertase